MQERFLGVGARLTKRIIVEEHDFTDEVMVARNCEGLTSAALLPGRPVLAG
jgi:hypothetical protein